jgi:dihydrofolate reductase
MGRKTFESIGKALPGRMNIVITKNSAFHADGGEIAPSLASAVAIATERAIADGADEICIIGGGQVYAEAMPLADRLYVTHVLASPSGDTVFPPIDGNVWSLVGEEIFPAGEKDTAATRFAVYERIQEVIPANLTAPGCGLR